MKKSLLRVFNYVAPLTDTPPFTTSALTTATASETSICSGESVVKYAKLVRTYTAVTMGREMMMARGRFLRMAHKHTELQVQR